MTADSSTTTVTHFGDGVINSHSRLSSLQSPWFQVVRGGGEPESKFPLSRQASAQHSALSDQLAVFGPASAVAAADSLQSSEESNCGTAGGGKKSAWNKPSANSVFEGSITPVMGAVSWPALSESTRSVPKSFSSPEQSSKSISDGLITVLQAPVISKKQPKPAKTNANNHSNTTNNHLTRQGSMKRGGSTGGAYRPPPPPPPPFPFFDITYCNYVPPMGGSGPRNNFGLLPRGNRALHNNGYGGRGPRSPAIIDVPLPPPPPRGYFRQPHPGRASYIASRSIRPYGTPMCYEMVAPFIYVPTPPMKPYRAPMLIPDMNHLLYIRILNQIEYYFSDANLVKDNFLRSNMDDEGWVSIDLIAGFRRVQNLTTEVQMILDSLKDSSLVETKGDKLRRCNDWRKWLHSPDFTSTDISVEEISIKKLTSEEATRKEDNTKSDVVEDIDHKKVKELTIPSKLANGEVSTLEACSSLI